MNLKFHKAALALIMSSSFCLTYNVEASSVPSDASKYKGHYYKVYNRSLNWHDAKSYCENKGGHLVTITSLGEQDFVADLIAEDGNKNCYWLGGHKSSKGIWRWVTNEPTPYANWAKGQPDNYTDEEDCVMMYRRKNPASSSSIGQWNDICWDGNCNNEDFFGVRNFGFICEWDSKSGPNGRYNRNDDDDYDDYDDDDNYNRNHRHRSRHDRWW